jgi:hypothetical protein
MTRNVRRSWADENDTDSDPEIWSSIRYLEQDVDSRKNDVVAGVAWIVVLLLILLLFYLLPHRGW